MCICCACRVCCACCLARHGLAANKLHGQTIPFLAGQPVTLLRKPLGVTAHTIAWNDPAQMLGRALVPAPALAIGNDTVRKQAEDTRLWALRFAETATAAGLPEGALNTVSGRGEEAGAALAAHPRHRFHLVSARGGLRAGAGGAALRRRGRRGAPGQ